MLKRKKQIAPQKQAAKKGAAFGPADTSGFTIIELMIVIAIFTIGILGTMSMQLAASKTNRNAREQALAMEYATDTMELLLNLGLYDNVDNNGDGNKDNSCDMWGLADLTAGAVHTRADSPNTTDDDGPDDIAEDAYAAGIFNLSWTVTNQDRDGNADTGHGDDGTGDGSAGDDTKQIDITVTWDGGAKWVNLTGIRTELL